MIILQLNNKNKLLDLKKAKDGYSLFHTLLSVLFFSIYKILYYLILFINKILTIK